MSDKALRTQLAPAYNAYLKAHPVDPETPLTEPRFLNLLEDAVATQVSDIHLDPGAESYRIRFRLDGVLHDVAELEIEAGERLIRYLETRAEVDVANPFAAHEGRASFEVGGRDWELRFSTVPASFGEKATLRLLGRDQIERGIARLGLSDSALTEISQWIEESTGMLLVAGPTGSGKTTSLYALLHEFKQREKSIITIENPIEYPIEGTTQIEVNESVGMSFAEGLKTVLRLDPDYLLLGEIRDTESAITAIDAAGTGRTLMSTIHSRDAVGAITTLRNYEVGNNEIASALDIVIAQRLVRRLCESCREVGFTDQLDIDWMGRHGLEAPRKSWAAMGCEECNETGFSGRIGIFELWRLDTRLREMIAAGAGEIELRRALDRQESHTTLATDGLEKAAAGHTTLRELRPTGAMNSGRKL